MTVSAESVRIFNELIDRGVLITYATARSFHSAYEITKDIRFKIPVITRNGTTLADQISGKEIETSFFSIGAIKELKELLPIISTCGFTSVYVDGEMYKIYQGGKKSKEFQGYIDYYNSIGDKRMRMVSAAEKQFEGNVSYITLISSREELLPYYEAVKDSKKWETVFQKDTYRDEFWLEICPKDSTKAKAVIKLKEKLECDRLVVFGDSINDLPMFEAADEAISVSNARPEILRAANRIIDSNENDAVAKYIEKQVILC
jgi:Cof subfamily protein (haloacid dehalogenase superfamily)